MAGKKGKRDTPDAKTRTFSSRDLGALKQGLAKVRQLLDSYYDYQPLDALSRVRVEARMAHLLKPYRDYLKNPSPEAYVTFRQQEGFLAFLLEPFPPPPPEDLSSLARTLRLTSPIVAVLALDPVLASDRVQTGYAALYRIVRDACIAAAAKNSLVMFDTALTLFGPRIRAENPLSRDPLLLREEQLWLANRGGIPRARRHEAQRQLRLIEAALLRGATSERRPPLTAEEKPLSHRGAVSRSAAVRRRMQTYTTYRHDRTAPEARTLIEEDLNKNARFSPEQKRLILGAWRRKVAQWEREHPGHP